MMINLNSFHECIERVIVLVDYIFKGLCAIGFLIQLSYILKRFFEYDYLTFVKFYIPEETILPDVFICTEFFSFLNLTLLLKKYPQLTSVLGLPKNPGKQRKRSIKDQILTRFSVRDASQLISKYLTLSQVTECLLPMDQIFGTLDIKEKRHRKVDDACEVRLFYLNYMLCFVFACSTGGPVVASTHAFYTSPVVMEFWSLRMKQSCFQSIEYVFIGANKPTTLPVSPVSRMDVQVMSSYPRSYRYQLKTVQVQLLPSPYATSCRDYSTLKLNYTSRDGIIDICLTQKSVAATGCPHPLSLQSADWNLPFAAECYERNYSNETFRRLMNSIVDDCFTINSQPDCDRKAYFIQGRAPVTMTGNFSTLVMAEIKEPTINIIYQPKNTWLECLVQIGSVLGTWFGFSILIHIPKISRFIVFRINSCIQLCNKNQNQTKSQQKSPSTFFYRPRKYPLKPFRLSTINQSPIHYEPPTVNLQPIVTIKKRSTYGQLSSRHRIRI